MHPQIFDIIIIGGGPAGSVCGIFLKKNNPNLRVAILEKQVFPRDKTCGDGLSPAAIEILKEVGLEQILEKKNSVSTFCLSLHGKEKIIYDLKRLPSASDGFIFPRKSLDFELIKMAESKGVKVFYDCRKIEMHDETNQLTTLTYYNQSGKSTYKGAVIIGADGSNSMVRKYLSIPYNGKTHTGIAYRSYCKIHSENNFMLHFDILKKKGAGYGWVFPITSEMANIGVGIDLSIYQKKKLVLNNVFKEYVATKKEELKLTIIENSGSGFTLPYGTELPALTNNNKVLIGDAASMINPLTGEGIYYAMEAGRKLAKHLAFSTNSGPEIRKALLAFSTDFMSSFSEHYRLNLMLKKILASPFSGFAIRYLKQREPMIDKAMNIILGNSNKFLTNSFKMRLLKLITRTA